MNSRTLALSVVAVCALHAPPTSASGEFVGTIREVWVNDSVREDIGWLRVQGSITSSSCSDAEWFVIDLSKPSMKAASSFALAAQLADKEVRLGGDGTCLGASTFEFLKFISIR